MLSCQRASWSGREAGGRRSRAEQKEESNFEVVSVAPWPNGPSGGSHVSRPELERGLLPQADPALAAGRPGVRGPGTCQPEGGGGRWEAGGPEGRDGRDETQICSYRRFPSSCYSKAKCFTRLGGIIKYGSAGCSVVELISSSLQSV